MILGLKEALKVVRAEKEMKGAIQIHATLANVRNQKIKQRKRGRVQNARCTNLIQLKHRFSNPIQKRGLKKDQQRQ